MQLEHLCDDVKSIFRSIKSILQSVRTKPHLQVQHLRDDQLRHSRHQLHGSNHGARLVEQESRGWVLAGGRPTSSLRQRSQERGRSAAAAMLRPRCSSYLSGMAAAKAPAKRKHPDRTWLPCKTHYDAAINCQCRLTRGKHAEYYDTTATHRHAQVNNAAVQQQGGQVRGRRPRLVVVAGRGGRSRRAPARLQGGQGQIGCSVQRRATAAAYSSCMWQQLHTAAACGSSCRAAKGCRPVVQVAALPAIAF